MILKNLVGRIQKGGGGDLNKEHPLGGRFMPHKSASFLAEDPNPLPSKNNTRRSKSVIIDDDRSFGKLNFGQRRTSNFNDFHLAKGKQANKPGAPLSMNFPSFDEEEDDASYLSLSTKSSTATDTTTESNKEPPPQEEKAMPRISFTPLPEEEEYYEFLFTVADVSQNGHLIHQNEARDFFKLSRISSEKLEIILGMAQSVNSLKDVFNKKKFNVVVRLIQLHQNKAAIKSLDLKVEDESLLRKVWFEGVEMKKKENTELASVCDDYNSVYDTQTCYTAPPKIGLKAGDDDDDDEDNDLLVAFPSLEKRMSCRSLGAGALQAQYDVTFDKEPTEMEDLTDSNPAMSLGDGNSSGGNASHICTEVEKCKSCTKLEDRCGKLEAEMIQMQELVKILTQDLKASRENGFTEEKDTKKQTDHGDSCENQTDSIISQDVTESKENSVTAEENNKEQNDNGSSCENQTDSIISQDMTESKDNCVTVETVNMERDDESIYESEIIPLDVIEEVDECTNCESQIVSVTPQDDTELKENDIATENVDMKQNNDETSPENQADSIIPHDVKELIKNEPEGEIDNTSALVLVPTLASMYECISEDDEYDMDTEDQQKLVNDAIEMSADTTILEVD